VRRKDAEALSLDLESSGEVEEAQSSQKAKKKP